MDYILEVIAFNIESCRIIEEAGGGRIELCANPNEGGTTVSYGMMKAAREAVAIPIFPIIRPRGGDFHYNEEEYAIMLSDIRLAKDSGMDGVVIGMLTREGAIDFPKIAAMVELAYPMEVTFHRAFDRVRDPLEALEQVIEAGCNRILTSGGRDTVEQGIPQLQEWIKAADDRIIILPGSGIRSTNIAAIATATGLREFHSSARTLKPTTMLWHNENMKESMEQWTVDGEEIGRSIENLRGKR